MTFLTEATNEDKLTHLEHAEDHPLNAGYAGFHHAVNNLTSVHHAINNPSKQGDKHPMSVSTKYDGSPSIVFGHHPETGRFFVASKSAFNVNPKINYSEKDIEQNHGHAPGLVEKLKSALKHLPKIAPSQGVFQGDVMHTGVKSRSNPGGDVTKDGEKLRFTPNTITYGTHQSSEEGKKVAKAKFGVAIHTAYKGKTLEDMKAQYNPDLDKLKFQEHPDVHVLKPELNISESKMSSAQTKQFHEHLAKAEEHYKNADHQPKPEVEAHHALLKSYLNQSITGGKKATVEGYKKWSTDKASKEIDKVKTPAVKAAKLAKHEVAMRAVDKNKKHFQALIDTHGELSAAKDVLVHHLNKSTAYEHHIGGEKTSPEGYVAVINNRPTKLVDRKEFSTQNAQRSKNLKQAAEKKDEPAKKKNDRVVMSFGRMNPPTVGHEKLVDKVKSEAESRGADHVVVLSHSQDAKKNPLTAEEKLKHAKRLFPNTNMKVATKEQPTILHHLAELHKQGYKHVTIVGGSDRTEEYQKLASKYNGKEAAHGKYDFKSINVVSSGERDPDAEGTEGMSASKMRAHATDKNFDQFKKGIPKHVSDAHAKELYNDVRKGMKLHEGFMSLRRFILT